MRSVLLIVSALFFLRCGGSLGGNPESKNPSHATVTFSLTDAPIENVESVLITIAALQVATKGESWIDVPLKESKEIDLLKLQDGNSLVIGESTQLVEGTYEHIRLVLDEKQPTRVIDKGGEEHPLIIQSADKSGLKIKTSFVVAKGQVIKMTLDFDLRKSLKLAGKDNGNGNAKYKLRPVLRAVNEAKAGSIKGEVSGDVVCLYEKGATKDNSDDCDNAVTSAKIKKSHFKIGFVDAGSYELRVFSASATPRDFPEITVTAGKKLDLGKLP